MTREELKEAMPILTAFVDGKTIQCYDHNTGTWVDEREQLHTADLYLWPSDFRIKPEPTYRPFKDGAECWQEMQKHEPFGWIKDIHNEEYIDKYYPGSKDNNHLYYQVQKVAPSYIKYDDKNDVCEIGEQDKSYKDVFGVMTFADGTPFGMKEE